MTDDDLDHLLRAARDDTAPLGDGLQARILADHRAATRPAPAPERWKSWLGGLVGVPTAAALGLWLGIAQPTTVLDYVPGVTEATETDLALLDDVFGAGWIEGDNG